MDAKRGQTVYSRSGEKYEFGEALANDRFLVYPLMISQGWEGEENEYASDTPLVLRRDDFFPVPPKAQVIDHIAIRAKELEALNDQLRSARAELRTFELEEKSRQDRLKRHEELATVDLYLAGKITHVVIIRTDKIVAGDLSLISTGDRYQRGTKLVTLFGDSNKNISWHVNDYKDGSGNWTPVRLFSCEEDAFAFRDDQLAKTVDSWRVDGLGFSFIIESYKAIPRQLPEDITKALHIAKVKQAASTVLARQESLKSAIDDLNILKKTT